MALTEPSPRFADTPPSGRLPGPDVVRAVALIGVVLMNYHGYLILRGGSIGDSTTAELFDPFDGPLATRFAATFVLVAGVSVTLLTRRSLADPARVREMRWRLVRRGLLLYVLGLLLDEVWPGTIILYYGAMFVLAAAVFTWRSRWIIAVGALAAVAAAAIRLWRFDRNRSGFETDWLTSPPVGSIRGYVFDVAVNGTHPLLPWFAFMCAGIVLGRTLDTAWWRPAAAVVGFVLLSSAWALSASATTDLQSVAFSLSPYDRGMAYVASALGSALLAYAAIDWIAERFPEATDPLRRAGQMSLTIYLLHIFVFKLVVDWLGWLEPGGVGVAAAFAAVFWVAAIVFASWWQRRYGRGPAEIVYRAIGG
jgi:uncharacterized membrane protein YeiB